VSDVIIRSVYEGRLKTWADARVPKLTIAFEDRVFVPPPDGSAYLKAYLLPGNSDSEDLAGAHKSYRGIFQVSVITKSGLGRGPAGQIADELAALFPNNLALTKTGFTVYVRSPTSNAPAIQSDTTSALPVSFEYRADTTT
jgi:Bacteriophage related domain of unknown function